jgi:hypothetical protein
MRVIATMYIAFFIVMAAILLIAADANAVPSYARQTNLDCKTCHYLFPELNSFGRLFKLHGYTQVGIDVVEAKDSKGKTTLNLLKTPPLSGMLQATYNRLNTRLPGTQNSDVNFPEQLSFFFAGQVTPNFGAFVQFTYAVEGASFNLDLVDIRYANETQLASRDLIYGATLNDNPTIQDVWNSTPIWGFPYATSSITPGSIDAALIDGGLERLAAGLGLYALWNNMIYAEIDAYRSAPQGGPIPPDSTSNQVIKNLAPYWRVVLQKQWPEQYLSVGTFGISAKLFPVGVSGPTDDYNDLAFDSQYERILGDGNLTAHGTYIHEKKKINVAISDGAELRTLKLNTLRLNANYYFPTYIGLGAGYFSTTGTTDQDVYSAAPVIGSRLGNPNTSGAIAEIDFVPWLNTKFTLQYVIYNKFNGAKTNYDGFGRNASDNNTLYLLSWFAM